MIFKVLEEGLVYSVDPELSALEAVGERFKHEAADGRLKLFEAKAESLPFPEGFFDAVVSALTLHHVARRDSAVKELWRVLRAGGVLILLDWTPSGGRAFHGEALLRKSMEEVLEAARAWFHVVEEEVEELYYLVVGLKTPRSKNF